VGAVNRQFYRWFVGFGLSLIVAGCAGKGEVVMLNVAAIRAGVSRAHPGEHLKVLVMTFEDRRPEKGYLGTRTHFWGGHTYFTVADDKPGEVVSQVLADYLKQKGWQAWVTKAGGPIVANPAGGLDVTLSGQVQEFSANAKSKFGSTDISVKIRVAIQARNEQNGSTSRMSLNGSRTETVFWFDPDDMEEAVNRMLKDSVNRLLADARIENSLLQVE
jgi:hypothetical protein